LPSPGVSGVVITADNSHVLDALPDGRMQCVHCMGITTKSNKARFLQRLCGRRLGDSGRALARNTLIEQERQREADMQDAAMRMGTHWPRAIGEKSVQCGFCQAIASRAHKARFGRLSCPMAASFSCRVASGSSAPPLVASSTDGVSLPPPPTSPGAPPPQAAPNTALTPATLIPTPTLGASPPTAAAASTCNRALPRAGLSSNGLTCASSPQLVPFSHGLTGACSLSPPSRVVLSSDGLTCASSPQLVLFSTNLTGASPPLQVVSTVLSGASTPPLAVSYTSSSAPQGSSLAPVALPL